MNKEELNKILELHKNWLNNEFPCKRADLRGADLRGADLRGADLSCADLRGADLRGAILRDADLRGADLRGANLSGADLSCADLSCADLSCADLSCANLDYSCLPLWCGGLKVNMDDRQVKQLMYHIMSIVKKSTNVSDELKNKLLTDVNIEVANQFHRVKECGEL